MLICPANPLPDCLNLSSLKIKVLKKTVNQCNYIITKESRMQPLLKNFFNHFSICVPLIAFMKTIAFPLSNRLAYRSCSTKITRPLPILKPAKVRLSFGFIQLLKCSSKRRHEILTDLLNFNILSRCWCCNKLIIS